MHLAFKILPSDLVKGKTLFSIERKTVHVFLGNTTRMETEISPSYTGTL